MGYHYVFYTTGLGCLGRELGTLHGLGTGVHQNLLVVLDTDVLLAPVHNLANLDLPQLIGHLRDQTEVVRDNHHPTIKVLAGVG